VPQRRQTAFAEILRTEPDSQPDRYVYEQVASGAKSAEVLSPAVATKAAVAKQNKAVSPAYTKLTAYIPRTLAAAIKMSMALDQTTDQSNYIEHALTEWLKSRGKESILSQVGQPTHPNN